MRYIVNHYAHHLSCYCFLRHYIDTFLGLPIHLGILLSLGSIISLIMIQSNEYKDIHSTALREPGRMQSILSDLKISTYIYIYIYIHVHKSLHPKTLRPPVYVRLVSPRIAPDGKFSFNPCSRKEAWNKRSISGRQATVRERTDIYCDNIVWGALDVGHTSVMSCRTYYGLPKVLGFNWYCKALRERPVNCEPPTNRRGTATISLVIDRATTTLSTCRFVAEPADNPTYTPVR
ncbi:hypothetical protein MPH_13890 [Macrophomina phaseolina MS6]|uniref:Uncharacterized protein n=1 Tax=Macrophomina phaseolina (strain MS6) TaxID=1126212 RepID=K2RXJ3_MACPH|nr:hypothetical protein MPH_13890 [Macrophomina phaseolina MS6]